MSIKVRLHPILRNRTGGQEIVEVPGHTAGECIENLESRFPAIKQQIRDDRGQLRPYFGILVNSEFIDSEYAYPKELTTPVKDGDQIDIELFAIGG
jgi:molybdopterin converting factor small subunit